MQGPAVAVAAAFVLAGCLAAPVDPSADVPPLSSILFSEEFPLFGEDRTLRLEVAGGPVMLNASVLTFEADEDSGDRWYHIFVFDHALRRFILEDWSVAAGVGKSLVQVRAAGQNVEAGPYLGGLSGDGLPRLRSVTGGLQPGNYTMYMDVGGGAAEAAITIKATYQNSTIRAGWLSGSHNPADILWTTSDDDWDEVTEVWTVTGATSARTNVKVEGNYSVLRLISLYFVHYYKITAPDGDVCTVTTELPHTLVTEAQYFGGGPGTYDVEVVLLPTYVGPPFASLVVKDAFDYQGPRDSNPLCL